MRAIPLVATVLLPIVVAGASSLTPTSAAGQVQTFTVVGSPDQGPPRDANAPQTGTARIRGRVVGADGAAPLRRAQVRLTGGGLREQRAVATDEQGRYEIADLPAGRYTLSASKGSYVTMSYGQRRVREVPRPLDVRDKEVLEKIDFALPKGGVIAATITDEFGEPMAGVSVQVQQFSFVQGQRALMPAVTGPAFDTTDDLGQMRLYGLLPGEYYLLASLRFGATLATLEQGRAYAPTYYPGSLSSNDAQRVTVTIGQEVSVTFPVLPAKSARITGVVVDSSGQRVPRPSVSLRQEYAGGMSSRGVPAQPDGSFVANQVLPGDYSIDVGPDFGAPNQGADQEYASVPVHVSGDDISGLVVTTTKGGTIRGRIAFDTGIPRDLRPNNVSLMTVAARGTGMPVTGRWSSNEDWTFTLTGLMGSRVLRLRQPIPGWYLKSVVVDGNEITDLPVDFSDGKEIKDVQVLLTQKQTAISGGVFDDRKTSVNEYVVVVFPADHQLWTPQSRFISAARPDQQGQFKVSGLPPGRYLAAAVDFIQAGEERDPTLLDRLESRATALTLDEGDAKTLNLTLTPIP